MLSSRNRIKLYVLNIYLFFNLQFWKIHWTSQKDFDKNNRKPTTKFRIPVLEERHKTKFNGWELKSDKKQTNSKVCIRWRERVADSPILNSPELSLKLWFSKDIFPQNFEPHRRIIYSNFSAFIWMFYGTIVFPRLLQIITFFFFDASLLNITDWVLWSAMDCPV